MRNFAFGSLCLLVVASPGLTQEKIDNPEFASWAKFKPGTSITLKTSNAMGQIKSETAITTTLLEVADEKLVVEMTVVSSVNGMEFKSPPTKREVPKSVTLPAGTPKPDPNKKAEGLVEEGTETLKISGMDVKAKCFKIKSKVNGIEVESKSWISDDVPGGLVKSETTTTGAMPTMLKMELTEFKKP